MRIEKTLFIKRGVHMTNELKKYYAEQLEKGELSEAQVDRITKLIKKGMRYEKGFEKLMKAVKGGSTNE